MKLKGIEFEYIEEDMFNKSPLLSQINPLTGKVPVLVHDGNPLPESSIILEYLDEVLESAWLTVCSKDEIQEKAVKDAIGHLERLEEKLGGRRFFGGDTTGYLDLMMGFIAYMLPVWEEVAAVTILDASKFPNLAAWKSNFVDHPAIKADLPSKDEMFTFFQWQREVHLQRI
ncbi:hypothetical protein SASPL_114387 [Salvia splendens]|uniref:glutathione transferase n=1 Tax=Salvia splendens TaxID=180675 RepID=A0A8X8Y5Y9_SALSN|nr:hypothetical protein SASPL_114387 [Salvia splendens]